MKAYTNSDKTVMEFAGHERLDTDRHYQHAVETERQRIIAGMENDARSMIPQFPGTTHPRRMTRSASIEIACLLEKTDGDAHSALKTMDDIDREEVMTPAIARNEGRDLVADADGIPMTAHGMSRYRTASQGTDVIVISPASVRT